MSSGISLSAVALGGFATALVGSALVLAVVQVLSTDLPSLEQLETYQPRLITRVLGQDESAIKEFYTERRVQVPLDSVSRSMLQAVLATEDRRFYHHWGVDPIGIARASLVNLATFSTRQGASTLTQQLARNLYLHRRQTIKRKIREAITAIQVERTYSKNEILQMYFTQMYFGHGAYGIQAAAKIYFGVNASELTLPQASMLAGLLKAPGHYSPFVHPEAASRRRNIVLHNMLTAGYITRAQYHRARQAPIITQEGDAEIDLGIGPYFTEWIRQQLEGLQEQYGFDYYRDGLAVQTTLDPEIQMVAEMVIDSHMVRFQESFNKRFRTNGLQDWLEKCYRDTLIAAGVFLPDDTTMSEEDREWIDGTIKVLAMHAREDTSGLIDSLLEKHFTVQVAFVAMDPETGDVFAMVGGRDFRKSKFNRAVQMEQRQPGSVFKPFVYTAAIDNGIYANHKVLNMVQPVKMDDGTWWRPENYSIDNRGSYVSLRDALRYSLNNVTVRLVSGDDHLIPIREVIRYAKRMGISTRLRPNLALALGSDGVVPLDVITAYGVFASGGVRNTPRGLISISDRSGQTVASFPPEREIVLSPETSAIMVDLLAGVVDRGTGGSARWKWGFHAPAAGKTGTTNNFTDAWFVGFTPRIVAGVWLGFDDSKKSLGPGQSGAVAALPIWANFMKELYKVKGWAFTDFMDPVGVVRVKICKDSGDLAGPYCPTLVEEIFRRGDEPELPCSIHRIGSGL